MTSRLCLHLWMSFRLVRLSAGKDTSLSELFLVRAEGTFPNTRPQFRNILCCSLGNKIGSDDSVDWEETFPCTPAGSKEPYSSTVLNESLLLPLRSSHRKALVGYRQTFIAVSTAYLLDSNNPTRNRCSIQRRMQSIFEVGNFGRWVITHS